MLPRGRRPTVNQDSAGGGMITVRMPKSRHIAVAEFARQQCGLSINQFVLQAIENEIQRSGGTGDMLAYDQLRRQVVYCLKWFMRDGSPCDGPTFRAAFEELRRLVGALPSQSTYNVDNSDNVEAEKRAS